MIAYQLHRVLGIKLHVSRETSADLQHPMHVQLSESFPCHVRQEARFFQDFLVLVRDVQWSQIPTELMVFSIDTTFPDTPEWMGALTMHRCHRSVYLYQIPYRNRRLAGAECCTMEMYTLSKGRFHCRAFRSILMVLYVNCQQMFVKNTHTYLSFCLNYLLSWFFL